MAPCFLVLLLLLSAVRARGEVKCTEQVGTSLRFSVTSETNATGHRNVNADLVNLYYGAMNGTGMDVLHSGGQCGDMQFLRLETAVTAWSNDASPPPSPTPSPPPTPRPSLSPAHSDYELFPGVGRYKFHLEKKPWADAKTVCEREGGNLILINSEAEADVVRTLYSQQSPQISTGVWAGFHSRFKAGHYETVFGDLLIRTGYLKWGSAYLPSKKLCGNTFRNGLLYLWNCDAAIPFICEITL